MSLTKKNHVGRSLSHEAAKAHVTGEALYTDDLGKRFANLLHAWPVMAPHAHAKVEAIRTEAAKAAPGVVCILQGEDVPGVGNIGAARLDEPMFPEEVLYHGQAVCWVLAESEAEARRAAALVEVDYDVLPAVHTIEEAIAQDRFHAHQLRIEKLEEAHSDIAAAIAAAPRSLKGEVHVGGQEHFYLECQAALAYPDDDRGIMVQASTQHPTETQEIVARILGVPKHEVTCQSVRMGGAFGGKEVQANLWSCVAALGARITGRPVRVRLDRQRDMILTGKIGRAHV